MDSLPKSFAQILCNLHKMIKCLYILDGKGNMDINDSKEQYMLPPSQPPISPLERRPEATLRGSRFAKLRMVLARRDGRIAVVLALGVVVVVLLYALFIATEGQVFVTPLPPPGGDIIVQVSPAYITRMLGNDLLHSGVPGTVKNVQVKLADSDALHSAQMTISGDDKVSVLGIGPTNHITSVIQLYINACHLQVHVLRADLDGIAMTGIATSFEGRINARLRDGQAGLPVGFTYCATGVRTKPEGMFVTYAATPV